LQERIGCGLSDMVFNQVPQIGSFACSNGFGFFRKLLSHSGAGCGEKTAHGIFFVISVIGRHGYGLMHLPDM